MRVASEKTSELLLPHKASSTLLKSVALKTKAKFQDIDFRGAA
ncbi:hypothetical protein TRICHSKD4_4840 [Roseibium sp. TrichSKD4]|nr:hypothetical protein TRICHSKD4_4840 [Roseibium sp. TrichSKD4]